MQVVKLTTHDGREFITDDFASETLRRVAKNCGGLYQVDLVEMTGAEYRAIPATSDSAAAFAQ